MKPLRWLFYVIFAMSCCVTHGQGIDFKSGSWKSIKEKALLQNKMIFVDCYTTWCSPCKWMDKNTFSNDSVGMFYNQQFINVKMNMEKGEGIQIKKLYNVDAYPTYLFVDGNGHLIYRSLGACSPKVFIKIGRDAIYPKNNLRQMEQRFFDSLQFTGADVKAASILLSHYKKELNKVNRTLDFYTQWLKPEDWQKKENFKLLKKYLSYPYSKAFDVVLKNAKILEVAHYSDSVNNLMIKVCRNYYFSTEYNDSVITEAAMMNLIETIHNSGLFGNVTAALYIKLKYAKQKLLLSEFITFTGLLCENAEARNLFFIRDAIDFVFSNTKDTALKMQAVAWFKPIVEDSQTVDNQFYFANLLYNAGEKEKGIAAMGKTIEMAGKMGIDTKMYAEVLLEMMKNRNAQ